MRPRTANYALRRTDPRDHVGVRVRGPLDLFVGFVEFQVGYATSVQLGCHRRRHPLGALASSRHLRLVGQLAEHPGQVGARDIAVLAQGDVGCGREVAGAAEREANSRARAISDPRTLDYGIGDYL